MNGGPCGRLRTGSQHHSEHENGVERVSTPRLTTALGYNLLFFHVSSLLRLTDAMLKAKTWQMTDLLAIFTLM